MFSEIPTSDGTQRIKLHMEIYRQVCEWIRGNVREQVRGNSRQLFREHCILYGSMFVEMFANGFVKMLARFSANIEFYMVHCSLECSQTGS